MSETKLKSLKYQLSDVMGTLQLLERGTDATLVNECEEEIEKLRQQIKEESENLYGESINVNNIRSFQFEGSFDKRHNEDVNTNLASELREKYKVEEINRDKNILNMEKKLKKMMTDDDVDEETYIKQQRKLFKAKKEKKNDHQAEYNKLISERNRIDKRIAELAQYTSKSSKSSKSSTTTSLNLTDEEEQQRLYELINERRKKYHEDMKKNSYVNVIKPGEKQTDHGSLWN